MRPCQDWEYLSLRDHAQRRHFDCFRALSEPANLFRAGYNQNNVGFFCNHAGFDALLGVDNFGNGRDVNIPSFFNGKRSDVLTWGKATARHGSARPCSLAIPTR